MALVLVINAYDAFREAMEYCLPKFGHEAISAADCEAGLKLATERAPDLVLVDVGFPKMTGLATCAAIKCNPQLCRLPVVMMLDRMTPEMTAHSRAVGVDALMPKPFEWAEFLHLLGRFGLRAASGGIVC
jgi:CheY-like chemotaxis protein